eukprot:TRINITY_DN26081_c0_g1_i1.p1 TRINITY_DN26081_c0_g1~~TRINITY_DN26081_c0_g1_i1.p1  ORF type:complete len:133 (-),score=28.76 TRINITY_DN26081_c0_g1_i1:229-627(-)
MRNQNEEGLQPTQQSNGLSEKEKIKEQIKVAGLTEFLQDPLGFQNFRIFLDNRSCAESLDFWQEVQKFKELNDNELVEEAGRISSLYVQRGSPQEINVIFVVHNDIVNKISGTLFPLFFCRILMVEVSPGRM